MAAPVIAPATLPHKPKKLLDEMRDVLRLKHYSLRTERSYCDWTQRFILFHAKRNIGTAGETPAGRTGRKPVLQWRHPKEMGAAEITQFLTHLARVGNVAASTQNQALSALLFLYKEVLKAEVGWIDEVERAKKPKRIPVVLTRDEVHKLFSYLHGVPRLNGWSSLWNRAASDGMCAAASKGHRLRLCAHHGARWQGRKGSSDDVAGESGNFFGATFGESKGAA